MEDQDRLLILGAGGHARVVAEVAAAAGYRELAFLDDSPIATPLPGPLLGRLATVEDPELREWWPAAVVAVGNPTTRLHWLERLEARGFARPALVHPSAVISPTATLADATVVMPQVAVNASARVGQGVILNTGCSVDHDVVLAEGVHICPGARLAGEVVVGARSWIGIGASVIQCLRIGADVTVGAGAAVIDHLPDGVTAVGVPARIRSHHFASSS